MNNIIIATDGYKASHHLMYPENTTLVFSNFTTRSTKYMPDEAKDIVVFGIQYTIRYIKEYFDKNFFSKNREEVESELKQTLDHYSGSDYDISHFMALYDLQYLPIEMMALPEGTILKNANIPSLVYWNTLPEFYWLTNFLETFISASLWKPIHSASVSYGIRKVSKKYLEQTDKENLWLLDYINHDFSYRGMQSIESAIASGMGFSVCSQGSDTMPVLWGNEHYYDTPNSIVSVPASEHAVATSYGKENEIDGFSRILSIYPTGIVSLVSDSYDFFKVHTDTIYKLKDQILSRDGKTVFRGDSGEPSDMICGIDIEQFDNLDDAKSDFEDNLYDNQIHGENDFTISTNKIISVNNKLYKLEADVEWNRYDKQYYYPEDINVVYTEIETLPEHKGQIELLWDCFGGTINEQGFKVLNSKCGAIWGDGVTFQRQKEISERLIKKGFATSNIVFGWGSYQLSMVSRDSQGTVCKATFVEVNGEGREIFKDPVTDPGKKSAKGLLSVFKDKDGIHYLKDQSSWEEVKNCEFKLIFKDNEFYNQTTLTEIRERVNTL